MEPPDPTADAAPSFDPVAAAYDILSDPAKRIDREGDFLRELAGRGRVLDLACATGVHAECLARAGATVTACDLSPAMIQVAQAKRTHARVRYLVRDMRAPPPGPFDLLLCIGNSLNMLPDPADVDRTLRAARSMLAPQGRLLLHVINPDAAVHRSPKLTHKEGSVAAHTVRVVKSMVPTPTGRLVTVSTFFRPVGGDAPSGWECKASGQVLLDLTRADLEKTLAQAGFTRLAWYGGLDGCTFAGKESADLVVVAESA